MRRLGAVLLAAGLLTGCGGAFPSGVPSRAQPAAEEGLPAPAKLPAMDRIDTDYEVLRDANVRAGPGTEYRVVTTVAAGSAVYVEGRVKGRNWYLVETGDGGGYVHSSLLAPTAAAEEEMTPDEPAVAPDAGEDELPELEIPAGGEDELPAPEAPVGGEDELPAPVGRGPAG